MIEKIMDVIEKSETLVNKLDEISVNQDFLGIFAFSQAHGYIYSGPTFSDELEALRETLKNIKN